MLAFVLVLRFGRKKTPLHQVIVAAILSRQQKKTPAMGALKPAATPAPDPAATRDVNCRCGSRNTELRPFATDLPISTLGPSGPREAPVPRVTAAAMERATGRVIKSILLLHSSSAIISISLVLVAVLSLLVTILLLESLFLPRLLLFELFFKEEEGDSCGNVDAGGGSA